MAKKNRSSLFAFYETQEGVYKINAVKNSLNSNSIESFQEIFATVAKTNLQTIIGSEFYAFSKKIADPGRFTLQEIESMANFFKVDFEVMFRFVRKNMIVAQKRKPKKAKPKI
ncbi:hypothetical protein [Flavitalea sp.]|nr:hypothetical protein [Flavitalea sp.]